MLLLLLPPPPSLSSHHCIDAVASLRDDVTGSLEFEHPSQRQGDNRAILTALEREEAADDPNSRPSHLPGPLLARQGRGGWVGDSSHRRR